MKSKNYKISIIIPCYNVEKYIIQCLESLSKQINKKEFEVILIDDKSKDKTIKLIEKFIKTTDLDITLIKNTENKGAGYSRNIAVKQAKYDYISFLDADDFIDDNYYEVLKKELSTGADIVITDINVIYEKEQKSIICKCCEGKVIKENIINNGLAASPCNKIIKKDLLNKYPFAEGIMNEDVASIIPIIINANKISYIDKTKYNYIQREKSVQNSELSDKKLDMFKSIDILKNRIKDNKKYDIYLDIIIFNQIISFFLYVPIKESNYLKRAQFLKKFNKLSKEYNIRKNRFLWNLLSASSRKTKYYYKLLLKLNCNGFSYTTSLLMSMYKIYQKYIGNKNIINKKITLDELIRAAKKQRNQSSKIKISAVIPNYNYEKFLYERIYSVLYQNYKIEELIILDDCSKDNSREIIDNIVNKLSPYINIKKIYNETNSGSAFKQWKKAFEVANGDYVWIAEADDYCERNLLKTLTKPILKNKNIVISYADTAFINSEGNILMRTIKPEIDIQKSGHWDKSYVNKGIDEIYNYSFLNCTIANVSSCIIKKDNYEDFLTMSGEYKQAGDWLFYVNVMEKGDIAYNNKALNYYRVHGNNVSSTMNRKKHIEEINRIYDYLTKKFNLSKEHKTKMKKRIDYLKKVWEVK